MANYYSPYTYDHNTAHILEPVQGYDIVSFMNFWAEMDDSVHGAVPGTVMHRDKETGKLKTGLEWDSMAQFLYSKQDSEDVLNSPVTANRQNLTSVGTISYGGFNTAPFQNPFNKKHERYGDGIASNIGPVTFTNGAADPIKFVAQTSSFTTFPGACGLELGSSEFARFDSNNKNLVTEETYKYDMPLTSPLAGAEEEYGTVDQRAFGGFLMPGEHYKDNICGILSQKPFRNENGTWMIRFWACHKPALKPETLTALGAVSSNAVPAITITGGSVTGKVSAGSGDNPDSVEWTATATAS